MKKVYLTAVMLLTVALPAVAQRPALVPPVVRFFDQNGRPLVGGKLYSYTAGTTTPLSTYVDSTTGALNTNPVILDSTGSATVFLGANVYKLVLQNSAGVQQWSADNIAQGMFQSSTVTSIFGRTGTVVAANGDYTCAQVTGAICSIPTLYYQTVKVAGSAQPKEAALNFLAGVYGSVTSPTVTAAGSGYTGAPTVTFTGGGCSTLPTGSANITSGAVSSLIINTAGAGCTTPPTVGFSGGGGTGATGTVALLPTGISCADNSTAGSTDCTFNFGGGGSGGGSTAPYTLVDQTSNRSAGVTYQNTTNTLMYISGALATSGSSTGTVRVYEGISTASMAVYANVKTATVNNGSAGFFAAILPGYYYKVVGDNAVGGVQLWSEITGGGSTTLNSLTFDASGAGASPGATFNGSAAQTISSNTIGAAPATGSTAYVQINPAGAASQTINGPIVLSNPYSITAKTFQGNQPTFASTSGDEFLIVPTGRNVDLIAGSTTTMTSGEGASAFYGTSSYSYGGLGVFPTIQSASTATQTNGSTVTNTSIAQHFIATVDATVGGYAVCTTNGCGMSGAFGTAAYQNRNTFSFGTGYGSNTFGVGTGGVTANTLISYDTSSPANAIAVTTSLQGGGGIAQQTVGAGGTVEVTRGIGISGLLMDGAVAVGHTIIPSAITLGYGHDSGLNGCTGIPNTTPIIGTAETTVSGAGVIGQVRLHPVASFGCAPSSAGISQLTGDVTTPTGSTGSTVATIAKVGPLALVNGTPAVTVAAANYGTAYTALGDSITICNQGQPYSSCYVSQLATHLGIPLNNYAISGEQECDSFTNQIAAHSINPVLSDGVIYSSAFGTNSADAKGGGAYQATDANCRNANYAWLGIPNQFKVLPSNSAVTTSGAATIGTTYGYNLCLIAAAGSCTFPITTTQTSGPIFSWYYADDSIAGTGTCTLDGTTSLSFGTQLSPAIATQNGGHQAMAVLRFNNVAAGAHTIVCSEVSGGVYPAGVGAPPPAGQYQMPIVVASGIPYQSPTSTPIATPLCLTPSNDAANCQPYIADIVAAVTQAQKDGLDVRYMNPRLYLPANPAYYGDQLHPNAAGQTLLGQGYIDVFNAIPTPIPPSVYTTSGTGAALTVQTTNNTAAGYNTFQVLAPNAYPGATVQSLLGTNISVRNIAVEGFVANGAGLASNYVFMGVYNSPYRVEGFCSDGSLNVGMSIGGTCIVESGTGLKLSNGLFSEVLTTPASSTATCSPGQYTDDANYHYVCTAANTWKSTPLISYQSPFVSSLATTGPITGGTITSTGTIACPTCVTASSPAAGVAHFAGGTQAATSSAVSLTADVSGLLANANLANPSTTVNGTTCTLGSTCTVTTSAPSGTANQVYATPNGSSGAATLRSLVAADVPILNQNTTGTAAGLAGSQTANTFYAAPNGSAGTAAFRAIVAADVPTLNQNTTGTASSATTATTTTNLAGGVLGAIPYQNAAGATVFLPPNLTTASCSLIETGTGSAGQAPSCTNAPALVVTNFTGTGAFNAANITATSNGTLTSIPTLIKPTTASNCVSSASPAVCGASASGFFVIAAGATTVTVNTTAVTSLSHIIINPDESLGSTLGVTCNTTAAAALAMVGVQSKVAGTSFTAVINGTISTNPVCLSYVLVN